MTNSSPTPTEKDPSQVIPKYVKDGWDLAIRRKWLILLCVILGASIGGVLVWLKVDLYRSETVILVEQQKITEKYVPSVVGGSTAERVSTITQQVLSRTHLRKIIDEFQLYPKEINQNGYESVIEGLRKNIKIQTKGSGGQVEAFSISFAHQDPMMAMKVTAKLASQYIEENLKIREQFLEGATEFLNHELVLAKEALDRKEKDLSEYKLKYVGELPGQLETNLRTLDRLQKEKTDVQEAINSVNSRLDLLLKSLHDYEALAEPLSELSGVSYRRSDGGISDPLVGRIRELKKELTKMLGEYTPQYPDVISLKTQINNLENELHQRTQKMKSEETNPSQTPSLNDDKSQNIIDPYIHDLMVSRDELRSQLGTFNNRLKKITEDMKIYEERISRTPQREQELLELERDYDNLQKHYHRLHENRINARISENLDKRQKGERFRILDPANLPTKPEGIPRQLLALGGLGGGIGLGVGLALLLDLLSPTFRRSEDAEVSLGLVTLATIPSFKMAYGKSMKMIAGELPTANGHQASPSPMPGLPDRAYIEAPPQPGRYANGRKYTAAKNTFPPQLNLVTKWRPQSVVAEQYRVAATRLDLLDTGAAHQVVLITSAMKAEGKTSTSANIAYTLARDLDEPTLVLDCDFKCSYLSNILGFRQAPGLAEYFAGVEPLEACLQQVPDVPLWGLSVGNVEEYPVPLSRLHNLSKLLDLLKPRYRFVILDGPPVLPLADINVLSGLADILLMVVRSGATPKDVVQKAIEMIHHAGPTRLVMTDAWTHGVPYYVRQGYATPFAGDKRE
jgi:polysaccharide biosynthesis transport protein